MVMMGVLITTSVRISNLTPKLDTSGTIVNGHDGTYRLINGRWYYHAAEYGLCPEPNPHGCSGSQSHGCGFHGDHNVSIWRSPDLSSGSWERVGTAAHCASDVPDCGIMYRPHLVQHPRTHGFLLYVNYVRKDGGYGGNAVLSAPAPEGPFRLENAAMNLARLCPGPAAQVPCGAAQGGAGDFDVFVDPMDGVAYIVYGANFWLSIEQLTPDMLNSTGQNASWVSGPFGGSVSSNYFVEAPAMFERNGTYYVLYGHCCCFCYQGSGIMVATARHPMGPWSVLPGDLACVDNATSVPAVSRPGGTPTPGQGCLYGGKSQISTTRAQQNFVISVPSSDGGVTFIWTGDRWQQAPDGVKGHEGQFWTPLHFDAEGLIGDVQWVDEFELPASGIV